MKRITAVAEKKENDTRNVIQRELQYLWQRQMEQVEA